MGSCWLGQGPAISVAYWSINLEALVICLIYVLHGMATVLCRWVGRTRASIPVNAVCGTGVAHCDLS